MVDEYLNVSVNRISPEGPFPVLHSLDDVPVCKLGGCANVAAQFKYFNSSVKLGCLYDPRYNWLFRENQIECLYPSDESFFSMPVKRRFLTSEGIQIIRHDIEPPLYGTTQSDIENAVNQVINNIKTKCSASTVIVLSDYSKGFFSKPDFNYIEPFKNNITIVDPKDGDLSKWIGCTVFKLNAIEAERFTGLKNWKEQSVYLQNILQCKSVVITHSGGIVSGVYNKDYFCYEPKRMVKAKSSVGAGDAFVAVMSLSLGHGFEIPDAIEIAWNAGASYVQKGMNQPVSPADLSGKIVNPLDLKLRDFGLVFTNGCYDLLHASHIKQLQYAKSEADKRRCKLVVGVNSDKSVKQLKGDSRPVISLNDRMTTLSLLDCIDFVVSFDEVTPEQIIKVIVPNYICKGGDYVSKSEIVGCSIVGEDNVILTPKFDLPSTTDIIDKILYDHSPSNSF
jgi:D-beta-D-heptose 7-phosphate kinase/D-beta-D-heptose 1-phosphate adenosyltransferase